MKTISTPAALQLERLLVNGSAEKSVFCIVSEFKRLKQTLKDTNATRKRKSKIKQNAQCNKSVRNSLTKRHSERVQQATEETSEQPGTTGFHLLHSAQSCLLVNTPNKLA